MSPQVRLSLWVLPLCFISLISTQGKDGELFGVFLGHPLVAIFYIRHNLKLKIKAGKIQLFHILLFAIAPAFFMGGELDGMGGMLLGLVPIGGALIAILNLIIVAFVLGLEREP